MQRVYTAASLPEAHLVAQLLQEVLIPVEVFNQNANGALGELPVIHPEVWIRRPQDYQRARDVILQHEQHTTKSGEYRGLKCAEINPATFEFCWQCGHELPSAE